MGIMDRFIRRAQSQFDVGDKVMILTDESVGIVTDKRFAPLHAEWHYQVDNGVASSWWKEWGLKAHGVPDLPAPAVQGEEDLVIE